MGIPGIALAIVLKMTVKEPPRGYSEPVKSAEAKEAPQIPFMDVLKTMWGFRSFRHLSLGAATQAFVGYGAIAWMPSFLVRTHDMSTGEVGTALGLIIGIFGGIGTFLGGFIGEVGAKIASKPIIFFRKLILNSNSFCRENT